MRLRIRRVLDNRQLLWRLRHVMRRWIAATPGTRAAVALSVTSIVANVIVFGLAVAVVGPYRPMHRPDGRGTPRRLAGCKPSCRPRCRGCCHAAGGRVASRNGSARADAAVLGRGAGLSCRSPTAAGGCRLPMVVLEGAPPESTSVSTDRRGTRAWRRPASTKVPRGSAAKHLSRPQSACHYGGRPLARPGRSSTYRRDALDF